jgi:hypothetical protein
METNFVEEVSTEILEELRNFYKSTKEYGDTSVLANYNHLLWKHYNNPNGKSFLIGIRLNDELIGALVLQKLVINNIKYLLACDFALKKDIRNLSSVIKIWKSTLNVLKVENNYEFIIHSSNNMSDKIYRNIFKDKRVTSIEPFFLIPNLKSTRNAKIDKTQVLSYINENKATFNWRWSVESKRDYIIGKNNSTVYFTAITQKLKFLRIMVVLDLNLSAVERYPMAFFRVLLQNLIISKSIIPVFFTTGATVQTMTQKNIKLIKFPKFLNQFHFPIYIHNKEDKTPKLKYFWLSILDVL